MLIACQDRVLNREADRPKARIYGLFGCFAVFFEGVRSDVKAIVSFELLTGGDSSEDQNLERVDLNYPRCASWRQR